MTSKERISALLDEAKEGYTDYIDWKYQAFLDGGGDGMYYDDETYAGITKAKTRINDACKAAFAIVRADLAQFEDPTHPAHIPINEQPAAYQRLLNWQAAIARYAEYAP